MNKQDYKLLESKVKPLATPEIRKAYMDEGLSMERFRWDCLWAAFKDISFLFKYKDSHINTALKRIIPE